LRCNEHRCCNEHRLIFNALNELLYARLDRWRLKQPDIYGAAPCMN
jgi:hypothetical protein